MFEEVAVGETREGKRDEERTGNGVELPTLRRDLTNALLHQQAYAPCQQVKRDQLTKAHYKIFAGIELEHGEQPVTYEREICRQQSQQQKQRDRRSLCHEGNRGEEKGARRRRRSATQGLNDAANRLRTQGHQTTGQDAKAKNERAIDA